MTTFELDDALATRLLAFAEPGEDLQDIMNQAMDAALRRRERLLTRHSDPEPDLGGALDLDSIWLDPVYDEDWEFCYQVKKAALGAVVAQTFGWDETVQRDFHAMSFGSGKLYLIRYKSRDIGTMGVVKKEDHYVRGEFHLLPECQGRGVGSFLLRQLMASAEGQRMAVQLRVLKLNHGARSLYERHGFEVYGQADTHDLMQTALH